MSETTVHQAIGKIISELEGVGKNQRNKEQGYNFRGVDDVLKAVHPLLGKHGVFFAPDIVEREYEERVSAKGTIGHCAHLHVRYKVYGPSGDFVEVSTWGEGLDYGDKATNKAMTAAFKYALFELFAVADPEEDADHTTPEPTQTVRRSPPARQSAPAPDSNSDGMTVRDRNVLVRHLSRLAPPVIGDAVPGHLAQILNHPVEAVTSLSAEDGVKLFEYLGITSA